MKKNKASSVAFKSGLCVPFLLTFPLSSCSLYTSTKYFAELVVSENTSVLKDNSFSESAYEGWYNFMNRMNPETGKKDPNNNTYNYFGNPATYQLSEEVNMPNVNEEHPDFHLAKGIWRRPGLITENTFRWIFDGGANAIIASGFNLAPSIEAIAPKFPNKGFFLIDSWIEKEKKLNNVATIKFAAEQSGYLSGIAAGEFLKANKDIFAADDGLLKAGGFVGVAFGSTMDFLSGFQMGLIEYNINQTNDKDKVEWINLGENIDAFSSGSFTPGGATTISNTLIGRGADIIITIAGPQVTDTIAAIESNVQQRPIAMVGVDTPQELNDSINKSMSKLLKGKKMKNASGQEISDPKIIQFSAVKKIDQALYSMLAAVFNKTDKNNANKITELTSSQNTNNTTKQFPTGGFGYANIGSYSNKSTGISDRGLQYIKKYNSSWVKQEDGKDLFDPKPTQSTGTNNVSVYEKSTYKLLQKGHFFKNVNMIKIEEKDITNFLNNSSSDKLVPMNNRDSLQFFDPLIGESAEPQYFGTNPKDSLDGSHWSLYKNGNNLKKETLYNRKEDK